MKKLFLSLVAAIVAATATFAQSSLIATLTHEGNVTVFHGNSSFKDAMAAAEDGDVISLAGGMYQSTDITKGVIIRGSGYEKDTISNTYETVIQGDFKINIPDSCSSLVMEGVKCTNLVYYANAKNATLMKSYFLSIQGLTSSGKLVDLTLLHCRVANLYLTSSSTANLINSYIDNLEGTLMEINNCYVYCRPYKITKSQFRNCLIRSEYDTAGSGSTSDNYVWRYLPSDCMVYNCVGYGYALFCHHEGQGNILLSSKGWDALFKNNDEYRVVLTDEAKAKYKGDDGTEVGMYGGLLPFDPRVSKPQITKCNIAQKTTADGKLSVDIEVKGVE